MLCTAVFYVWDVCTVLNVHSLNIPFMFLKLNECVLTIISLFFFYLWHDMMWLINIDYVCLVPGWLCWVLRGWLREKKRVALALIKDHMWLCGGRSGSIDAGCHSCTEILGLAQKEGSLPRSLYKILIYIYMYKQNIVIF